MQAPVDEDEWIPASWDDLKFVLTVCAGVALFWYWVIEWLLA